MIKQKKSVSPSQTPAAPEYSDDHRLRAIAELTPDAFLIFDISGKVHYWNEAAAGMYGYSREEIFEKSAFCLIPQRLLDGNLKGLNRLLLKGPDAIEKKRIETYGLRKDGSEFPIEYSNACWKEGETIFIGAIIRDISEQRRLAEEREKAHKERILEQTAALRESENRYRAVFENTGTAMILFGDDTIITMANSEAEKLSGFIREEIEGKKSWTEFVHPEDLAKLIRYHRQRGDAPESAPRNYEYRLITRQGEIKDIYQTIITIPGASLRVSSLVDITSLKTAEKALLESEGRYRSVIETASEAILIIDADGRIEAWNQGAEDMYGYTKQEAIGQTYAFIIPEELRERQNALFHSKNSKKNQDFKTPPTESLALRKNGVVFSTETSLAKWRSGDKVYFTAIIRDITERRRSEQTLQLLRFAMDHTSDAIACVRRDGSYLYVNEAYGRMLEYSADELLSLTIFDMNLHPSHVQWYASYQLLKQKRHIMFESTLKRRSGKEIYVENLLSYQEFAGEDFIFTFSRDITERKKTEMEVRQTQKMEAIGTLAGGIAHDFNNILSAIMGYTELSLLKVEGDADLEQKLSMVLKSAIRARDLVKQILTFSRKEEIIRKPLEMHLLVQESLKLLRASLPTTIEIRNRIDEKAGIVLADPTQIHQVLMNLCTNAAQAIGEMSGMIEVRLEPVALTPEAIQTIPGVLPGSYVRLTVTDTGSGIAPEILDRIFEPFFTTKEVHRGTGMGLAVVHGIVKGYGGAVTVHSTAGKGASFTVFLPRVENALHVAADAATLHSSRGGTERILFVDDESCIVSVVQEMLESLGYTVTSSQSSAEALELFLKNSLGYDLVITDQAMPVMTGYELAKKVIAIRPGTPVMLCTGYSDSVSEEKAAEAGIKAFILKPLQLNDIAQAIRAVLDSKEQKKPNCRSN